MSVSEKTKTINNKIEQSKAQYNLDRWTAKIWNVSRFEFLTDKGILPEKHLLEKAVSMKRFKYSSLGKELKTQTVTSKKKKINVKLWI